MRNIVCGDGLDGVRAKYSRQVISSTHVENILNTCKHFHAFIFVRILDHQFLVI